MTDHTWISPQWFQLLQTMAIVGSLLFTAYQVRRANRAERISHMLAITQAHRDIWSKTYDHPELARIRRTDPDLEAESVTESERVFVVMLILHLNCVLELSSRRLIIPVEGMEEDVRQFFSRPIPQKVWNEISHLQNNRLVQLVEGAIKRGGYVHQQVPAGKTKRAA